MKKPLAALLLLVHPVAAEIVPFSKKLNFTDARTVCQDLGGDLVSAVDLAALENLLSQASLCEFTRKEDPFYWVGLFTEDLSTWRSGEWEWADGANASKIGEMWRTGEPNNKEADPGEFCAMIGQLGLHLAETNPRPQPGRLLDVSCALKKPFLCNLTDERVAGLGALDWVEEPSSAECRLFNVSAIGFACAVLFLAAMVAVDFRILDRRFPDSTSAVAAADGGATQHKSPSSDKRVVDTVALTGIRGFAAVHIAIGHYCSFSSLQTDLLGGASMSFFYLLSGYVMTLGYGRDITKSGGGEPVATFAYGRFIKRRLARVLPTYLWANLASVAGAVLFDPNPIPTGALALNVVLCLFFLNVPLLPLFMGLPILFEAFGGLPPAGVTWTIQTMLGFYILFPRVLRWAARVPPAKREGLLNVLFWTQLLFFWGSLLLTIGLVPPIEVLSAGYWGYWTARSWPFSRLPVFMMGVLAAVERMHGPADDGRTLAKWGKVADRQGGLYLGLLAVTVCLVKVCFAAGGPGFAFLLNAGARNSYEPLCTFLFLRLIVALSYCGDEGIVARACRSRFMQFLGRISMALYMFHMNWFGFFALLFGEAPGIIVLPATFATVMSGWIWTVWVEEPFQKKMRGGRKRITATSSAEGTNS